MTDGIKENARPFCRLFASESTSERSAVLERDGTCLGLGLPRGRRRRCWLLLLRSAGTDASRAGIVVVEVIDLIDWV